MFLPQNISTRNTNFTLAREDKPACVNMIRLLTKKEIDFLRELAPLIQKYDALFSISQQGDMNLTVYEGENTDTDPLRSPIPFQKDFDENDIYELLENNDKLLKQISDTTSIIR